MICTGILSFCKLLLELLCFLYFEVLYVLLILEIFVMFFNTILPIHSVLFVGPHFRLISLDFIFPVSMSLKLPFIVFTSIFLLTHETILYSDLIGFF